MANRWDGQFAKAGGRYWAIVGKRSGYALEVYPEEAVHYRKNLKQALGEGSSLLGEFDTYDEAIECVTEALRRKADRKAPAEMTR